MCNEGNALGAMPPSTRRIFVGLDRIGAQSEIWIPAPARMTGDNETALLSGSLIRYSRPAPWSGSWGQNWMANISGGAIRNTPPVSYRPWSSKARRCQGGVSRVIRLSPQLRKGPRNGFHQRGHVSSDASVQLRTYLFCSNVSGELGCR